MITRILREKLDSYLKKGKVLIIYGPRRAGKTFLLQDFLSTYEGKCYSGVGEDATLKDIFASQSVNTITSMFGGYDLVVIDEAQKINDIGLGLKILVDNLPQIKVIATGSSSFDLAGKTGEPLTGRKFTTQLYPIAISELKKQFGNIKIIEELDRYLVYGLYPEVVIENSIEQKRHYLHELRDSYLLKDIWEGENLRYRNKFLDLLRLVAYQIGKEVSLSELATQLSISKQTVERYLELLEKSFVLLKVGGFSSNLRKEITKSSRYYFWDNGIRNAVINNFNLINSREDKGELWENFLFIERVKKCHYEGIYANRYFWRTYNQSEIDLVEEREGNLFAYEFKYSPKKVKIPQEWIENYPKSKFEIIHKDNFLEFV